MKKKSNDKEPTLGELFAWDGEAREAAENRPVIEFWSDERVNWVSRNRGDKNLFWCQGALKSSPFCPIGWH